MGVGGGVRGGGKARGCVCVFVQAYSVLLSGAARQTIVNGPRSRSIGIVRMCSRLRSMGPAAVPLEWARRAIRQLLWELLFDSIQPQHSTAQRSILASPKKGGQRTLRQPRAPVSAATRELEIAYRGLPPGLSIGWGRVLPQLRPLKCHRDPGVRDRSRGRHQRSSLGLTSLACICIRGCWSSFSPTSISMFQSDPAPWKCTLEIYDWINNFCSLTAIYIPSTGTTSHSHESLNPLLELEALCAASTVMRLGEPLTITCSFLS